MKKVEVPKMNMGDLDQVKLSMPNTTSKAEYAKTGHWHTLINLIQIFIYVNVKISNSYKCIVGIYYCIPVICVPDDYANMRTILSY